MMSAQKKHIAVIENHVAALCKERGLDRSEFVGICLLSRVIIDGKKLTAETAGRVFDGATQIDFRTAALVAKALEVEIEKIFKVR